MSPQNFPDAPNYQPVVSVIMANHNNAAYLVDAISSVQKQTLKDLEIIVSDDASTDASIEIVARLMAADSRIRLIKGARSAGPAGARNRALDVAKGEWIAIVDSDDLVHPERLATLVEMALRDDADLITDDLLEFDSDCSAPSRRLLWGKWRRHPFWVDIIDYVQLNQLYGRGPGLGYLKPIIRTSILKQHGARYDETLKVAEDFDLVLRLLRSGSRMRIYPLPLYFYRKHSRSTSHRLNRSVVQAIRDANVRFSATLSEFEHPLAKAINSRMRSIDTALAYENLLAGISSKNWVEVLRIATTNPKAAALLRLPIGVRLRRLSRSLMPRKFAPRPPTFYPPWLMPEQGD